MPYLVGEWKDTIGGGGAGAEDLGLEGDLE